MEYIDSNIILSFFKALNASGVKYAIIRNIGGELPDRLKDGKDIDLLVHHEDMPMFMRFMKQEGFKQLVHPVGRLSGWNLAYQMHDFLFFRKKNCSFQFYVDVCQELCCHSLMPYIWIPLDKKIQNDAWEYRWLDEDKGWWCLDERITLIAYIIRAVFDKQKFENGYIEGIKQRLCLLDDPMTKERLELVFFKYTNRLIEMLIKGKFDHVITDYYGFRNY